MGERKIIDAPINLSISGLTAEMVKSEFYAGWDLIVDGVTQSNVVVEDPSALNIGYVRHLGDMIDSLFPGSDDIDVLHLGAGAMTLVRYIAWSKPESIQTVVELEKEIIELVSSVAPLEVEAEILYGDAREVICGLLPHSFDLIISDMYLGINTPSQVATLEFYEEVRLLLRESGVLLCNVTDSWYGDSGKIADQFETIREAYGAAVAVVPTEQRDGVNALIAGASRMERLDGLSVSSRGGNVVVVKDVAGDIVRDGDGK